MCVQGWLFGVGWPAGVLFPGEDHFSPSQHSLVVWSSLCMVEASWSFPCPLWNVCYCICLLVWGDTSSIVGKAWRIRGSEACGRHVELVMWHLQSGGRRPAGTSRGVTVRPSPGLLPLIRPHTLKVLHSLPVLPAVAKCSITWAI